MTAALALLAVACGGGAGEGAGGRGPEALALLPAGEVRVAVGEARQLRAVAWTGAGAGADVDAQWSVEDPDVASVLAGRVVGLGAGRTWVEAAAGAVRAELPVRVSPPGAPDEAGDAGDAGDADGPDDPGGPPEGGAGDPPDPGAEAGGAWVLGPWAPDARAFRPMAASDVLPMGTCGQGAYHVWASGAAAAGPAGLAWGTATVRVLSPDPKEHSVRVRFVPEDDGAGGLFVPGVRVPFTREPDGWVGRTAELSVVADDPALGTAGPAAFIVGADLDRAPACCDPCGPEAPTGPAD